MRGAIVSGPMLRIFSTWRACSAVLEGMVSVMRLQASGAMQFERTLKAAMSSAIALDRPTMPSLAAQELACPRLQMTAELDVMFIRLPPPCRRKASADAWHRLNVP